MKKLTLCLLLCTILLFAFAGCAEKTPSTGTPTPETSSTPGGDAETLVDNITFRRGENADGEVLFTGEALEEVYVSQDEMGYYMLCLSFTEEGKQLLAQYTTELASTGESLSIWIGKEQVICTSIPEAIMNGQCSIANDSSEEFFNLRDKFYGVQSETE